MNFYTRTKYVFTRLEYFNINCIKIIEQVKFIYCVQNKYIKTNVILEYVGNRHSYYITRTNSNLRNKCVRTNILQNSPIYRV